MEEIGSKKEKIIDILYIERSGEIYEDNYNNEYKIMERDRNRLEEVLSNFLKENLSQEKYEIAKKYLEDIEEKNISINTVWNRRFYGAGFCDGVKL